VRLVTVGDVMVDVVTDRLPMRGERAHARVQLRAGGSAVNAALVARELGADTQVIGRVGRDAGGVFIISTLAGRGVDAKLARDDELPTGTAIALGDAVVADRGANACLSHDDLPSPLQGDAVLVSGFALFQDGSREAAVAALETFEGEWTAVDLASPRLARADFDARVVFATRAEATAVPRLESRFEIVCVKDDYSVERTSPFGAGDAFAAGMLYAALHDWPLEDAAVFANAVGAAATTAVGAAEGLPTLEEVAAWTPA
jgi:ribokinase